MKRFDSRIGGLLVLTFAIGCGGGDVEEAADAGANQSHATPATISTTSESVSITLGGEETNLEKDKRDFVPVFAQRAKRDPFAPLASLPEPEPEPEPEPTKPERKLPSMKLLGFVSVDGPRAMIKVKDKLHLLAVGDKVGGAKVLAINAPEVTLEFRQDKIAMNLFNFDTRPSQPTSGSSESLATNGDTRRTNPRIAVPRLPMGPQGGGSESRIPGLPSAGNRPSIQLPAQDNDSGTGE